jgi:hypothetical protein
MILPTKHQNLNKSPLIIGAEILSILKKREISIENLFQKIRIKFDISLETFFDSITFLWLINSIRINEQFISKVK